MEMIYQILKKFVVYNTTKGTYEFVVEGELPSFMGANPNPVKMEVKRWRLK